MKRLLLGLGLGLVAGAAMTWVALRPRQPSEPGGASAPAAYGSGTNDRARHLSAEQIAAAGLKTATPEPSEWRPRVRAFGRVLDPAPLATLLAEIESARAAAQASEREYERLKALNARDTNAPARAVEAAEASFRRDRVTLGAAQDRLLAGWGKALVERADLAKLTHSFVAQEAALVRLDLPAGETLPPEPRRAGVALLPGNGPPRDAELLGPAPMVDAQAQGAALLVWLPAPAPAPGTALIGWVSGGGLAQPGLRLPPSAVVRHEGQSFVFVRTGDNSFVRRRVELAPPQADGVLVTNGIAADDRVVVTGAQQLLSDELKGALGEE